MFSLLGSTASSAAFRFFSLRWGSAHFTVRGAKPFCKAPRVRTYGSKSLNLGLSSKPQRVTLEMSRPQVYLHTAGHK